MTHATVCLSMALVSSTTENTTEVKEQRTIPVYEPTRERVRQFKLDRTWDELINELADVYENER